MIVEEKPMLLKNPFKKDDPLLKIIMKQYQLNLLSVPREKSSLGDVYIREGDNKRLSFPSHISSFLDGQFELPTPMTDEKFGNNVSGATSDKIDASIGLEFLEGFLNVLSMGSFGTKVRTYFQQKGARKVKFNFADATRDSVQPEVLRSELGRYHVKEDSNLSEEGRRYYIVTGLAKSPSISIIAEGNNQKRLDIDAQAADIANFSSDVSIKKSQEGKIIFNGKKRLVFGVELFELEYNRITRRFRLKQTDEVFKVRKAGEEVMRTRKVLKPALIGNNGYIIGFYTPGGDPSG
jgi:hypothetical protein